MAERTLSDSRVRLLVVSPLENDLSALSRIVGHSAWTMESVQSVAAAKEYLAKTPTCVVLCEQDLPDGDWKQLFADISSMEEPALLIVLSESADDHLWAEVLSVGAYDVLVKPFDPQELYRVIGLAWRHRMDSYRSRARRIGVQSESAGASALRQVAGVAH